MQKYPLDQPIDGSGLQGRSKFRRLTVTACSWIRRCAGCLRCVSTGGLERRRDVAQVISAKDRSNAAFTDRDGAGLIGYIAFGDRHYGTPNIPFGAAIQKPIDGIRCLC